MESKDERLHRIEKWAAGYRVLMQGGLHSEVHMAGTKESEMGDGSFAALTVDDVEWLLSQHRPAHSGRPTFKRMIGRQLYDEPLSNDMIEQFYGPVWAREVDNADVRAVDEFGGGR